MFAKTTRFYSFSKIAITRSYAPRGAGGNPGINRQLKILKDNLPKEFVVDAEGFGDIETDFMDVHKSHKQNEIEMRQHHDIIQKKIITQKYFKHKQPNFLTYAEKEQIKLLYNRNPEEWTAEKISESFPADIQTIKKIIKAKWIPRTKKRIIAHDETVIENWELLKLGKFPELHPDLVEHIQKFTNRTKEDLKNLKIDWDIRPPLPNPKNNEFLSIITSCKQIQDESKLLIDSEKRCNSVSTNMNYKNPFADNRNSGQTEDDETYLIDKIKEKEPIRFQDLKKNNILYLEQNKEELSYNNKITHFNNDDSVNYQDDSFVDQSNTNIEEQSNFNIQKYNTNEVVISESDMKKFNVTPIKERIHIPRKLWKRGATYKVQDCYYDYDGEFLYRVPGMIQN